MEIHTQEDVDFCTLGMFIIDDIYPAPSEANQTPRLNVIGGGGTYSAVGARVLSPPPLSKRVGWIVDAGTDFPPEVGDLINSWQSGVVLRERDGPTTKGWNGYGANEHRAFKYLTPKLRLTHTDLSGPLLNSKSYHLICSPLRCIDLVTGIKARRAAHSPSSPPVFFIWEPVPDLCVPDELQNTLEALKHVDVISPNHAELGDFFSVNANTVSGDVDKGVVEDCASHLLKHTPSSGAGKKVAVVVRSGKDGCYIATSQGQSEWLPAYHSNAEKVVDPTGGGNGFLGGFAVGLVRTGDVVEAAMWGNVGASFCIEQVGVPVLGRDRYGRETWNGVVVEERLKEFLGRNSRFR